MCGVALRALALRHRHVHVRGLERLFLLFVTREAEAWQLVLQHERADDSVPFVARLAVLLVAERRVDDLLRLFFEDRLVALDAFLRNQSSLRSGGQWQG